MEGGGARGKGLWEFARWFYFFPSGFPVSRAPYFTPEKEIWMAGQSEREIVRDGCGGFATAREREREREREGHTEREREREREKDLC